MQPLNYLMTTGGLIWVIACVPVGIFLAWLAYFLINKIPASWLCDYGETPSAELLSGKRVKFVGSGIVVAVITVICLVLCRLQFNKGYDIYFVMFSLIIFFALMIAVCDLKYTIIPDQFTIAIAVLGIMITVYDLVRGFHILHGAWWSPIAGAAIGGGAMMLIDLIGMLIYHKTGMGFGDVKLFAAIGIITGFPGTFYAFAISLVTGMVFFLIILIGARVLAARSAANGSTEEVTTESVTEPSEKSVVTAASEQNTTGEEVSVQSEDETIQEDQQNGEGEESEDSGSYLAFGPYIAIALICYLVFFDVIQFAVNQYLGLFRV